MYYVERKTNSRQIAEQVSGKEKKILGIFEKFFIFGVFFFFKNCL